MTKILFISCLSLWLVGCTPSVVLGPNVMKEAVALCDGFGGTKKVAVRQSWTEKISVTAYCAEFIQISKELDNK